MNVEPNGRAREDVSSVRDEPSREVAHTTSDGADRADDRADQLSATARARRELLAGAVGEPITIANEFAEVTLLRVNTRNGARLFLESPKSGQWISLDPLELESLTWQSPATFSALVGHPFGPLITDEGQTS